MYDTYADLLDAMRAAPEILDALLEGVSAETARVARGGDEGWSVVEVLCHLRDAERMFLGRAEAMRDEETPHLPAFDQDEAARQGNYAAADLRAVLAELRELRQKHVAALSGLPPEGWERSGLHSELGRVTISAQTLHMVAHDAVHAAQIGRQITQARRGAHSA
jgi:uncharacterized damage-inducible protein DinB